MTLSNGIEVYIDEKTGDLDFIDPEVGQWDYGCGCITIPKEDRQALRDFLLKAALKDMGVEIDNG